MDNRRVAKGATLYLPVAVAGAYLSMGDAHMAQVRDLGAGGWSLGPGAGLAQDSLWAAAEGRVRWAAVC